MAARDAAASCGVVGDVEGPAARSDGQASPQLVDGAAAIGDRVLLLGGHLREPQRHSTAARRNYGTSPADLYTAAASRKCDSLLVSSPRSWSMSASVRVADARRSGSS